MAIPTNGFGALPLCFASLRARRGRSQWLTRASASRTTRGARPLDGRTAGAAPRDYPERMRSLDEAQPGKPRPGAGAGAPQGGSRATAEGFGLARALPGAQPQTGAVAAGQEAAGHGA